MEGICDEVRSYNKGRTAIKFTTIYPVVVLNGMVKSYKSR